MNTNKKWETLASIIVWLVIIGIIISSIITIINSSHSIQWEYIKNNRINLLRNSTENIVKNLNLNNITIWEEFYLYKDTTSKKYSIFTWTINSKYKYINENWELITGSWIYDNKYIFSRSIIVQKEDDFLWKKNKLIKIYINDLTHTE